jgi:DNA-binding response OmpR family regulator
MPSRILSVSYKSTLRTTRDLILRQQGYSVRSASSLESAVELCRQSHFDLVIIDHDIPLADQETIANVVRTTCAAVRILALTSLGTDSRPTFADASMNGLDGPHALLRMVRGLLEQGSIQLKAAS